MATEGRTNIRERISNKERSGNFKVDSNDCALFARLTTKKGDHNHSTAASLADSNSPAQEDQRVATLLAEDYNFGQNSSCFTHSVCLVKSQEK
ncbi:hypothetical protein RRG08_016356 [Elysia crispata]|uniref:Uncharacterized protein n=1 Tax=Elysia crispata TaxID=231223 RepID=A0AAE0Z5I6_9GAST|nr:hypothetical protein RRG08_016356 [Elysia crispata]